MERISNIMIAGLLGMSHAQVSRLRSGDRPATLRTIQAVSAKLGWSIEDQIKANDSGDYAIEFEAAIRRYAQRATTPARAQQEAS